MSRPAQHLRPSPLMSEPLEPAGGSRVGGRGRSALHAPIRLRPGHPRGTVSHLLAAALMAIGAVAFADAPPPLPEIVPTRLILNPTTAPATSIAITWRTGTAGQDPAVQFAESTPGTAFKALAVTVPARTEAVVLDTAARVFNHSAILTGLQPGTAYLYRVGSAAAWSEWNQFTTAAAAPAPFTFVYFGDPQDDLKEHVTRVFRAADLAAPDAAFWLITGDLTSEPEDDQVRDLYHAAGPAFRTRPIVPVVGNHDLAFVFENGIIARNARGKKVRSKAPPAPWRAQFTLPENGPRGLEELAYHFDFQGVRVIVINSNDRLADQAAWLELLLAVNPSRWTIVAFHHPVYSAGRDRDDRETRDAFLTLFDRYHVDLVLTGHDHAYARTHPARAGAPVAAGERGTVYVVSVCGPKFYSVNSGSALLMAKTAGERQLFQTITIDGPRLRFRSIAANGELNDAFELVKPSPAAK